MLHEIVEALELVADFIIVGGSAWITYLFWRTYKRTGTKRTMWLSALFAFIVTYFTIAVVADNILGIPGTGWSHTRL